LGLEFLDGHSGTLQEEEDVPILVAHRMCCMERCVGGWIEKGETTPALVKCGTNEEELELGRLNDEVFWGGGGVSRCGRNRQRGRMIRE
jgi:hypothetical protein